MLSFTRRNWLPYGSPAVRHIRSINPGKVSVMAFENISSDGEVTIGTLTRGSLHLVWRLSEMEPSNSFYVTLSTKAMWEFYENNKHVDFTVKLSWRFDLGSSPNWDVGVCEVWCSWPPLKTLHAVDVSPWVDNDMIHYNLISAQFVGESTVRCMRTFPTASCRLHEFLNDHYDLVEQQQFQSIRVEFQTLEGLNVPFEDSNTPTNMLFQIRNYYTW